MVKIDLASMNTVSFSTSKDAIQISFFSKPVFCLRDFPGALRLRHHPLLELLLPPVAFKYILEGYPERNKVWDWYTRGWPFPIFMVPGSPSDEFYDKASEAPGMASLVRDSPPCIRGCMPATKHRTPRMSCLLGILPSMYLLEGRVAPCCLMMHCLQRASMMTNWIVR